MANRPIILLIEDNPVDALLIREFFNILGNEFKLETVGQLSEGLALLRKDSGKIKTILLDLTLSDSQGLETFEKVFAIASHIPIIIITSFDDEKISFQTVEIGAQDYLMKSHLNGPLLVRSIRYAIKRKQAEQKLAETLDLNQKIISASSSGTLTYKESGECVYANEASAIILNASISQLLDQNFHQIESWKKSGLYTMAQKVLRTKKSYQKELKFVTSFGKEVGIDCFLATFTSAGQNHLLLIFSDITERVKTEKNLEWQKYLMQALMDNYPDDIYFKNKQSKILRVSKAMAFKHGYKDPDDLIGKTDFDLFSEEHAQKAFEDELKIIETGEPLYNIEEKETYPGRNPTWVITTKMPLLGKRADIIGTFGISKDITQKKMGEEELLESKHRFQSLFEDSPTPIWEEDFSEVKKALDLLKKKGIKDFLLFFENNPEIVRDLASKIKVLGINKAVLDLHDASTKDQLIRDLTIIFNEQTYKTLVLEFANIAEGKRIFDLEQELLTLNKEKKHAIIRWSVAPEYETTLTRVLISIVDITHRKKAEEELQVYRDHLEQLVRVRTLETETAKQQNELILNAIGEGVFGVNLEGKITFINPAATQMLGWEQNELLYQKQHPLIHHTKPDGSIYKSEECPISHAYKDGQIHHVTDELFWRKNGSFFPVEYISTPIWETGQLIGAVVVFSDITTRKKAEIELRTSEERYRMLADNVGDVIWTMDLTGRLSYISPSVERQLGYSAEEAEKMIFDDYLTPSSKTIVYEKLAKIAEKVGANQYVEPGHLEAEEIRKDGVTIWIEVSYNAMYGLKGQFLGLLGVSRDITDRKQLILELQNAKAKAEIATRAKSEFLANMSHEIRTPMNVILGFADLLYTSIRESKQHSQIESIRSSARSLLGIINDILDFSKIEAGKLNISYEPVNLQSLIEEIEIIFSQEIKMKGLSFCIEIKSDIPKSIMLNEGKLRQILFNLIGNAIKFTDEGNISLILDKKSNAETINKIDLMLSIQDTGIGIKIEQQEAIFEAFNQQDDQNMKKYGGTGLGLTITKRLVEMMNGTIMVESEPGKGSRFQITFREVEISSVEALTLKEKEFDPNAMLFVNAKILICDDNQSARKLMIDLFDNPSMTLLEAGNGKEATELAALHIPDVILMDIKMPVLNGKEAARIIKSEESTKAIPIIAVSASSKVLFKDEESKGLFDNFLLKPIKINELIEVLKHYLTQKTIENSPDNIWVPNMNLELGIEQLSELISNLEINFLPQHKEVLQNQRIDQIEIFGRELALLGARNGLPFLEQYGKEIISYADNFEIEKLLEALKVFPIILGKLKLLNRV